MAATEEWLGAIEREAYLASAALAAEKGPFPLFDRERYLAGETIAGARRTMCATRSPGTASATRS